MTQQTADRLGVPFEDLQKYAAEQTPLGGIGEPEDIATVIVFLCSEDASYVSGQVIYVRGGPLAGLDPSRGPCETRAPQY